MGDRIKFGILGCGLFGEKSLVPGFQRSAHAELIAITKQDPQQAREKAKKYQITLGYGLAERALFLKNQEIEAVYVATPNGLHMQDCIDVMRAGKHVIVEKPMAMNVAECQKMITVSKETDKKLMIAHCFRYNTIVNLFKNKIIKGELGDLILGTADFLSDAMKSQRKWKYNWQMAGGGPTFDLGVHLIDTLRWLTGFEIQSASIVKFPRNLKPQEMELIATYLLEFEHQFTGRITSSYIGTRNLYLEIFGTRGYMRAFDWNPIFQISQQPIRVEQELDGKFERSMINNEDHYSLMIDAFAQAIKNNLPSPIPGEEGLKNQKIIDMVYQ